MGSNSFRKRNPDFASFDVRRYEDADAFVENGRTDAFLVNEEKESPSSRLGAGGEFSPTDSPASDAKLDRDLVGCAKEEALQHAQALRMELRSQFSLAEGTLQHALQHAYAVTLTLMAAPTQRRLELLDALGCKGKPDKPFLSLINGLAPILTPSSLERKRESGRKTVTAPTPWR